MREGKHSWLAGSARLRGYPKHGTKVLVETGALEEAPIVLGGGGLTLNDVLEAPEVKLELEEPVTFAPNDLY